MLGITTFLQRCFARLGLLVLAVNLVLVSIPRCEALLSLLPHHADEIANAEGHASCHEAEAPASNPRDAAISSHRLCECAVLKFMAFDVPEMNLQKYLIFQIQSVRLLTFPWEATLSDFQPLVEPPYPKA